MSKFIVEIFSPDGKVTKQEIESALQWLMNHDGVAWRGWFEVEEVKE